MYRKRRGNRGFSYHETRMASQAICISVDLYPIKQLNFGMMRYGSQCLSLEHPGLNDCSLAQYYTSHLTFTHSKCLRCFFASNSSVCLPSESTTQWRPINSIARCNSPLCLPSVLKPNKICVAICSGVFPLTAQPTISIAFVPLRLNSPKIS